MDGRKEEERGRVRGVGRQERKKYVYWFSKPQFLFS